MKTLPIDDRIYTVYSVLPPAHKTGFIHELLNNSEDCNAIITKYVKSYFTKIKKDKNIFNTLVYKTNSGNIVNIIFQNDIIHINSDSALEIRKFVKTLLYEGHIIVNETPKTKHSNFYLPYYAVYKKLNTSDRYPMIPN